MNRGPLIAGVVVLATALFGYVSLGGCAKKNSSSEIPVLIINNAAEPQTLDPAVEKGVPEARINVCVFEGLTNYDPKNLAPTPGVAEKWDLSADGTVYTFHIRPAARDTATADNRQLTVHVEKGRLPNVRCQLSVVWTAIYRFVPLSPSFC